MREYLRAVLGRYASTTAPAYVSVVFPDLIDAIRQDQAPAQRKGFGILTKRLALAEPVVPRACAVLPDNQAVTQHIQGIPFRKARTCRLLRQIGAGKGASEMDTMLLALLKVDGDQAHQIGLSITEVVLHQIEEACDPPGALHTIHQHIAR